MEISNQYKYICVGGCQRSGTRIGAKSIAYDMGYRYVDEDEFGVYDLFKFIGLFSGESKVIHCPTFTFMFHFLKRDDIMCVFMDRDVNDIDASQAVLNWYDELEEISYSDSIEINLAKIERWVDQKDIVNGLTLKYKSLRSHPLWVENRKHFNWRQTI